MRGGGGSQLEDYSSVARVKTEKEIDSRGSQWSRGRAPSLYEKKAGVRTEAGDDLVEGEEGEEEMR